MQLSIVAFAALLQLLGRPVSAGDAPGPGNNFGRGRDDDFNRGRDRWTWCRCVVPIRRRDEL